LGNLKNRIRNVVGKVVRHLLQNVWQEIESSFDVHRATNVAHVDLLSTLILCKKLFQIAPSLFFFSVFRQIFDTAGIILTTYTLSDIIQKMTACFVKYLAYHRCPHEDKSKITESDL
jgi:hypothetical protein